MVDKILIGVDRDGTIIEDMKYLGKEDSWREQITLCKDAVKGLKKLRSDPRVKLVVATNQAGVARGFFPVKRVEEVDEILTKLLKKQGVEFDGWYFCPYVGKDYAMDKGVPLNSSWIKEGMRKPAIDMLKKAAKDMGIKLEEFKAIYYMGDKPSDVQTGINAGGKGVLITNGKSLRYKETKGIESEHPGKVFFAGSILEAANAIIGDMRQTL